MTKKPTEIICLCPLELVAIILTAYSLSSKFSIEHQRAPSVREVRHLESEETSVAGSSTRLISETFFHYGSRGLLQLLVDGVENLYQLTSPWSYFHAPFAGLCFHKWLT